MTEHEQRFVTRKNHMARYLAQLTETLRMDLVIVSEKDDLATTDLFFHLEEGFSELDGLFLHIRQQVEDAASLSDLTQSAQRLDFVEDRLDELEAQLYNRPRRRRRRFSLFRFFRASQNGASSPEEIVSPTEAYQTLGLEEGAEMPEVTAAFRRFVKACHPDVRGGDRSAEAELRKIIEAYQVLKQHLGGVRH